MSQEVEVIPIEKGDYVHTKRTAQGDHLHEEVRKKDHNYSDLFEMEHGTSHKIDHRVKRTILPVSFNTESEYQPENQGSRLDRQKEPPL